MAYNETPLTKGIPVDPSGLIVMLYSVLMILMVAAIPLMAIMMIVGWLTKTAKKGIREINLK
jgi:hypothetical protein